MSKLEKEYQEIISDLIRQIKQWEFYYTDSIQKLEKSLTLNEKLLELSDKQERYSTLLKEKLQNITRSYSLN